MYRVDSGRFNLIFRLYLFMGSLFTSHMHIGMALKQYIQYHTQRCRGKRTVVQWQVVATNICQLTSRTLLKNTLSNFSSSLCCFSKSAHYTNDLELRRLLKPNFDVIVGPKIIMAAYIKSIISGPIKCNH